MRLILFLCATCIYGCSATHEFSGSSMLRHQGPMQSACDTSGIEVGTSEYDHCIARARSGTQGAMDMLRLIPSDPR
jgi:hypothetical protein